MEAPSTGVCFGPRDHLDGLSPTRTLAPNAVRGDHDAAGLARLHASPKRISGTFSWSEGDISLGMHGPSSDWSGAVYGYVRAPDGIITTFDAPNAGTGPGQGTFPTTNNPGDTIAGFWVDSSGVYHGFVRR